MQTQTATGPRTSGPGSRPAPTATTPTRRSIPGRPRLRATRSTATSTGTTTPKSSPEAIGVGVRSRHRMDEWRREDHVGGVAIGLGELREGFVPDRLGRCVAEPQLQEARLVVGRGRYVARLA